MQILQRIEEIKLGNLSMVERICRGGKSCKKCSKEIPVGAKYWSGPYKSLCIECYDIEKTEGVSSGSSSGSNDDYVVSGQCSYCPDKAIGILWTKKVCLAHVNQALTESI